MADPLTKLLIISDVHVPYHSSAAVNAMLEFGHKFRPDIIVANGDIADFYTISSFDKDPKRKLRLGWEIRCVRDFLTCLQKLGASRYEFLEGNHEDRLQRYMIQEAPALVDLSLPDIPEMNTQNLLALQSWGFTPYQQYLQIGKLCITHDCGRSGQAAVRHAMNTFQKNVVIGHTHRMEYLVEGTARGVVHLGASLGWLGDPKKADYRHRILAEREWVHGFGIGYMEPNGRVRLTPCPIVGGKVLLNGELV